MGHPREPRAAGQSSSQLRHYEPAAPLKVGFTFNNLAKGHPLRLARLSTTEHDWFPQNSREAMRPLEDVESCHRSGLRHGGAQRSNRMCSAAYVPQAIYIRSQANS